MAVLNRPTFSGIAFPPKKSVGGFFAISSDNELIANNITTILYTRKGEMPGIPEFGNSAYDMVFEPLNQLTQQLIADMILKDIERWETRVIVDKIIASSKEDTRIFEITVRIKSTGELFSVTAPFST